MNKRLYAKDGTPIMDLADESEMERALCWEPIKIEISNLKHQRTALRNQVARQRRLANQKKRIEEQNKKLQEKLELLKVENGKR